MTLAIPKKELKNYRYDTLLPLICESCDKIFHRRKTDVKRAIKGKCRLKYDYCSYDCRPNKAKKTNCSECGKEIKRLPSQLKIYPQSFCNKRCATISLNRNIGKIQRSKIEIWLEAQLSKKYCDLPILFNDSKTIHLELDILFPTLNIAFEINGIAHYKSIYGKEKLSKTQQNDRLKLKRSNQNKIELFVIDISKEGRFTPESSTKYLNYIENIVDSKMRAAPTTELPS